MDWRETVRAGAAGSRKSENGLVIFFLLGLAWVVVVVVVTQEAFPVTGFGEGQEKRPSWRYKAESVICVMR